MRRRPVTAAVTPEPSILLALLVAIAATLAPSTARSQTHLVLDRDTQVTGEYKGVVELTVKPPFESARISVTVDGQKVSDALRSPYKMYIDLGPTAVEHKITVTAYTADWKKVQWRETINRGLEPLAVKVREHDPVNHVFEADVTSPKDDPVELVEFWNDNALLGRFTQPPYRLAVTEYAAHGLIHVTARTKSGEEADDFISNSTQIHVEQLDVRTVPIFVSVIDRNGNALDNLDRSSFRILDNGSEAKIVEFQRAFNQPISIALLVDTSSSMAYELPNASRAAFAFAQRTLRQGDRCSVLAIRDVPRRERSLTTDKVEIEKALRNLRADGQTALYDSIVSAIRELKDEKNRKAIVILTDGGDTSSIASFEETEQQARLAGIPIYVIAYGDSPDLATDLQKMKYLSAETGGFLASANGDNLARRYASIEKDLRAQYAIRYQISDLQRHNEWRQVKVVLSSPKLTARTIKGYFAQ